MGCFYARADFVLQGKRTYSGRYFARHGKLWYYKKELEDKELVISKIVIDNYDEAISKLTEAQRAVLTADTDKHIYSWAQNNHAVIKKQERDKYNFYFEFQITRYSIEKIYKLKEDLSSQYKLDLLGIYNRL